MAARGVMAVPATTQARQRLDAGYKGNVAAIGKELVRCRAFDVGEQLCMDRIRP